MSIERKQWARSQHTTPLLQTPIKVKYKYNYGNLPLPQTRVNIELVYKGKHRSTNLDSTYNRRSVFQHQLPRAQQRGTTFNYNETKELKIRHLIFFIRDPKYNKVFFQRTINFF